MKNPILSVVHWYVLHRDRSKVPTTLMPLKKIKSATVYVDAEEAGEDAGPLCRAVKQFFDYQGIPVLVLCPTAQDVNLLGYLKARMRGSRKEPRSEDLFISLASTADNFAATYEACCSTARFKVGRCALPGGVFDLVVTPPGDSDASQAAAFAAIKDYLYKIK